MDLWQFLLLLPRLGPARLEVGECLGAEGISRQRDEVVPGNDARCVDLRANSQSRQAEGSVLSAGEIWRENREMRTGCLLRKAKWMEKTAPSVCQPP